MSSIIQPEQVILIPQNIRAHVYEHIGREKRLVDVIESRNLIVNVGVRSIVDTLFGYPVVTQADAARYIALGTDSTATTASTSTLGAEVFRKAITRKRMLEFGAIMLLHVTTDEANGNTIREIGLFSKPSSGTLYARAVHDPIIKTISLSILYSWSITGAAVA